MNMVSVYVEVDTAEGQESSNWKISVKYMG